MIRTEHECQVEYREHMRDGEGTVQITNFITGPAELNEKGRLFAKITLNPGCSIGYHIHEKDAELFYIMKGTAEYKRQQCDPHCESGRRDYLPYRTGPRHC